MMRYAHAHWLLAALLPLTVLAFWPDYFLQMRGASIAHHVHGAAGMLWMLLAAMQSWSIATRRIALHRTAGRAVYAVVPLFVAGSTLAIIQNAAGFAASSDPFRTTFGARLTPLDVAAAIAMPLLVRHALVHRRAPRATRPRCWRASFWCCRQCSVACWCGFPAFLTASSRRCTQGSCSGGDRPRLVVA